MEAIDVLSDMQLNDMSMDKYDSVTIEFKCSLFLLIEEVDNDLVLGCAKIRMPKCVVRAYR